MWTWHRYGIYGWVVYDRSGFWSGNTPAYIWRSLQGLRGLVLVGEHSAERALHR